jgi:hypothetical protein
MAKFKANYCFLFKLTYYDDLTLIVLSSLPSNENILTESLIGLVISISICLLFFTKADYKSKLPTGPPFLATAM